MLKIIFMWPDPDSEQIKKISNASKAFEELANAMKKLKENSIKNKKPKSKYHK